MPMSHLSPTASLIHLRTVSVYRNSLSEISRGAYPEVYILLPGIGSNLKRVKPFSTNQAAAGPAFSGGYPASHS